MHSSTILGLAATFLVIEMTSARGGASLAPGFVVRSWNTSAGLPEPTVNAITQTKNGFLWVGTNGGLAQFDGISFRRYGLQDGLRSIWIMSLAEDRDGTLWIGTVGGGLSRWDSGTLTSNSEAEGLPEGRDVLTLAADPDGSLWIGTENGLWHRRGGKITEVKEAQGLPRGQVRKILMDSRGTLWVSVLSRGMYRASGGRFEKVEKPAGGEAPGGGINSLAEALNGEMLAAGYGTIWRQSGEGWQKQDGEAGLQKADLTAIACGSGGLTWAGTRSGGLYLAKAGRFERLATRTMLDTNHVLTLFEDRQGLLWAGTAGAGLFRVAPRVMQFTGEEAGLPAGIMSLAEDTSGTIWAATTEGLFQEQKGQVRKVTTREHPEIGSDSRVLYCAAAAADGSIWAAGEGCALRFEQGKPAKRFTDAPVAKEAIRALCADGSNMWMGTYYSTLLKGDANGIQVVAPARTFPGGITSLAVEAEDTIWVGSSKGLHRWEKGKMQTWDTKDGLLTASIQALHRDTDGTLWMGTQGGGLVRMRDGKFVHFTMRHGLIEDTISQIVADDYGCLWLAADRGLMCLERRELEAVAEGEAAELHPVVFGRQEGLLVDKCAGGTSPNAIKTRDGRVLFPAGGGIAGIDPLRIGDLKEGAPQTSIQDIILDHQPHPLNVPLVIPPGNHRLEISYTAPLLRGGEWVRFRHKLEGLDKDWVPAGRQRQASYDGLQSGRYVFHVSAADGKGTWNDPAAPLAITVQPFFWQTIWFRAGGLILLAGMSGGAAWWHTHRKHARQMAVVESERKLQAELAHLSRVSSLGELSASLAHELNQPLGIILANAQAARRLLDLEPPDISEVRAILSDIVDEGKRGGEVIKRLRALLKRGETTMVPVFLHEIIHGVLRLLQSDLISRGVTVQTDLEDSAPCVPGDQVELQQVLINLIINACDAMGGNIQTDRKIRIGTRIQEGRVIVSVADQGCGLPEGAHTRIFEPFFTTKTNGMGIGLSICRSIITAHHGRLWAGASEGGGSTFFFELEFIVPHS